MTEILLYGIVGDSWDGLDAKTLVPLIAAGDDDLDIRINSPGGYIVEGLAIYNAIIREAAKGRKVTTHIDGLAASMASVIAMAGGSILMAENALMMIHNPWDIAMGDAAELRAAADKLDLMRDQLVNIYAKQTGLSADDLIAMLNAETWLTADQALAQKFVTEITGVIEAAAQINVEAFGFRKTPETARISAMAMLGKPKAAAAVLQPQESNMTTPAPAAAIVQPVAPPVLAPAAALTSVVALTAADVTAAVAAERDRTTGIRALATKHKLDGTQVETMLAGNVSLEQARAQVLDILAERGDALNVGHTGPMVITADERDKWQQGAAAWVMTRAGVAGTVAAAAKIKGEKIDLDPGEFRGVSMVALATESLQRMGIKPASRSPDAIIGSAFTARNAVTQGTGDFTTLLENVMHKVVQSAYLVTPDTWSRFCGIGTVTDFRDHNRYLVGSFGVLDALNELGEFKQKPIPDGAGEKIKAITVGNIISLSRQAMKNDDMGAFSTLAVQLGRAAKLTIEVAVYSLLNSNPNTRDGFALFSTQHGNLVGAGGPPSVAAIDAMRVMMMQQTDVSGNEVLDLRPAYAVAPAGLGGILRVINGAQFDPDASGPAKSQIPNRVLGIFDDIIDTARLIGTPYYLFANKDVAPAIEVAFLDGEQEPHVESEAGWRVDGTEWKVRHDFGAAPVNSRSAIKNPGA